MCAHSFNSNIYYYNALACIVGTVTTASFLLHSNVAKFSLACPNPMENLALGKMMYALVSPVILAGAGALKGYGFAFFISPPSTLPPS